MTRDDVMIRPALLVLSNPCIGWSHVFQSYVFHQGRIQDLSLEGAKSSAEGARIEELQVREYMGVGHGERDTAHTGVSPSPENFSFLGLKLRILVRSPAHLECLFLQRNTSRSRPVLRLSTLTFQADCGSIKGAGVSAEEGTEHYLSW